MTIDQTHREHRLVVKVIKEEEAVAFVITTRINLNICLSQMIFHLRIIDTIISNHNINKTNPHHQQQHQSQR